MGAFKVQQKINISLVSYGLYKSQINIKFLMNWESKYFKISNYTQIKNIAEPTGSRWEYTDKDIEKHLVHTTGDITIALTDITLEYNYYLRRIHDNVCILSTKDMAEIMFENNYAIEHFILRNIYPLIISFYAIKSVKPLHSWSHVVIKGCFFDKNAYKTDILFSMDRPIVCEECSYRILDKPMPLGFLEDIQKEYRKLKRPLYYRINRYVKNNLAASIAIIAFSTIILNIISNIATEYIK